MKAEDVLKVIRRRHSTHRWCVIEEMRLGSGFGTHERRIDLWALDCAPSRGNPAIAYEVKVSRSDFLKDLQSMVKQRGARMYSNEFWYAAPKGLIRPDEIPVWAGLLEIDPEQMDAEWYTGTQTIPAPHREKARPSWPFIVSLIRRGQAAE